MKINLLGTQLILQAISQSKIQWEIDVQCKTIANRFFDVVGIDGIHILFGRKCLCLLLLSAHVCHEIITDG